MERFRGFDKRAPGFFHELASEQSRDWFNAHKDDYLTLWQRPMEALLGEVRARLAPAYRGIKLSTPKVFRIHRDVRFAKDKTPYKTHIAGVIGTGGAAAIYLHLGLEEFVGAGTWELEPDRLAKWRKLVAADKSGREIAALVAKAEKARLTVGAHETLVRVPKPYDAEHPRADLLRRKGFTLAFPPIPAGLIHDAKLATWLASEAKKAAPVVTWLTKKL
jgi:uncharacterized protein (TIGR02453 family)